MSDEDEENEIIVERDRKIDDDGGGGGGGGGFWGFGGWGVGGGGLDHFDFGGGGGPSQPPPEEEPVEGPEIVVEATRPTEGQEDFADDNDVFNDGEAPTANTVLAWLEQLYALDAVTSYFVISDAPDNPEAGYTGEYVTSDGDRYIFESDGADNYGRYQQPSAPPPPPTGPQLGLVDDWELNPPNDPNVDWL